MHEKIQKECDFTRGETIAKKLIWGGGGNRKVRRNSSAALRLSLSEEKRDTRTKSVVCTAVDPLVTKFKYSL
jgi:hypothetical protein